jgi:hypothetical protein
MIGLPEMGNNVVSDERGAEAHRQTPDTHVRPLQQSPRQSSDGPAHVGAGSGVEGAHRPLVQLRVQHSSMLLQNAPSPEHAVDEASTAAPASGGVTDPQRPSRQMNPSAQSVSTLHALGSSSQAMMMARTPIGTNAWTFISVGTRRRDG